MNSLIKGVRGKVLVAQGGGPTMVINQSLVGIVREARKFSLVDKVYGALHGVNGIKNEIFCDLSQETRHNLEMVASSPSSALLSTRDKPDFEYCHRMFEVIKAHDIRYFFYIGGNDSADTTRIINEYAKDENYEFCAIHVPKTIDNDLVINDHTPGFGSAALFVASAFSGINYDNYSLPGVYVAVVMGRHAGFLTAASSMAQKHYDDGPHLIYVPERSFDMPNFLNDVQKVYDKLGRCVIAVSEGVKNKEGEYLSRIISGNNEVDAHGNVSLAGGNLAEYLADTIKRELGIKRVRGDTFGYLQRSFPRVVSNTDMHESREVAERAVQLAMWNFQSGSMVIKRTGNYSVDYELVSLDMIAAKTKYMPDEFINEAGNHVTDAFRTYITPILGESASLPSRLRYVSVPKILNR